MKIANTVLLSAACIGLTGCQGITSFFASHDRPAAEAPDMTSYFAQLINDGRRHLAANRPGSAIRSFRQASYHPDYAGEAYNGMAVAYDRMGRYDLAERYFSAAVEAAPDDERFARNFARFETVMLARSGRGPDDVALAEADVTAAVPVAAQRAQDRDVAPAVAVAQLPERMERLSSNEVRIASRDDWMARVASAEAQRPAVIHVGRSGSETVLADAESSNYPVRINLAEVDRSASVPVHARTGLESDSSRFETREGAVSIRVSGDLQRHDRPAYPVRIQLDPS